MAWDWLDDTLLGNSGESTNAALRNPVTAFNFVLEVEALYFMALKSVKVFNKENEYEYINEGGVNDYVHMRRKPISKPFTFQVERYVGTERFLDPLANGTELIAPVLLYVYRYQPRQAISESAPAWPARIYTFTGCVVTAKEYGELNSEKSSILTETTTIAYRELVVVTNPFEDSQEKETYKNFEEIRDTNKAKYANATNFDSGQLYEKKVVPGVAEGKAIWVRKPNETYTKPNRNYDEYVTNPIPKYANGKSVEVGYKDYITQPDKDGIKHTVRVDSGPYNKEAKKYEDYASDTTPTWANKKNTENDTSMYKIIPDRDGTKHLVRSDKNENYNKPARKYKDYKENTAGKWAANSPADCTKAEQKGPWNIKDPDANKSAEQSPVDSSKPKQKGPWNIKNPTANKSAEQSPKDSSKAKKKGPWNIKNPGAQKSATQSPRDSSRPEQKGPWNIGSPDSNKSATQSPMDSARPEAKGPWDIKSPDANKSATQSPADSSKPEAKEVWSIKSPEASRSSVSPATDSAKPEVKGPWDIKQNTTNPKPSFAAESPRDHEKPEAVKWPPTRRALMAQALSGKSQT